MLVSGQIDHRWLFENLRTVIIDEVHAFAGDDRGWHLLSVLGDGWRLPGEKFSAWGFSATAGNPDAL